MPPLLPANPLTGALIMPLARPSPLRSANESDGAAPEGGPRPAHNAMGGPVLAARRMGATATVMGLP